MEVEEALDALILQIEEVSAWVGSRSAPCLSKIEHKIRSPSEWEISTYQLGIFGVSDVEDDTVDGRNPAPVDR